MYKLCGLVSFILLVSVCGGCDEWHKVEVTINEWHGDLNVITDLSHNDVDLKLLFGDYVDRRPTNDTITVTNDLMDIKLLADYDEYGSPVLYGIVINGVDICRKSGGSADQFKKSEISLQTTVMPSVTQSYSQLQTTGVTAAPYNVPPIVKYKIQDECGIVIPKITPYIHHGTEATASEFPWHATLFDVPGYQYRCGGSLISSRLVVTAAHCVTKSQTSYAIPTSSVIVFLGKDQLQTTSIVEQKSGIDEIHVHSYFDPNSFYNDIAVIKLVNTIQFTNFVRPVCIWPHRNDRINSILDEYGTVPGFGYNENWQLPDQLTSVKMPVVSYETCLSVHRNFYARVISETNFCAGSRNGSSVCNGDSGGGMVFKLNSLFYLRGIVSIGPSDTDSRTRCNPWYYILFTDVAKYVDWLKQF